ncbi:helix-turn-helix domain-containing protein [Candidatus Soleaferrea massiliensis]|uniref:helix-turn-helix domain-containing protein n=1 Tax=Candidatus Soleaferrea massiliensis TaxID=1470354 RepID=UPI000693AD0F|nr:helix-turn-helix transcriptional regulator [Candidatus Soleaferrea massiliensis]
MTFGERLREARLQNGLTQEQLAQQIGVAKSTLTGYEKGNREPDVFKIKRILEVLCLDSDYLLGVSRKTQEDDVSAQTHEKYLQLNDESRKIVDSLIEHLFKMQTKGPR